MGKVAELVMKIRVQRLLVVLGTASDLTMLLRNTRNRAVFPALLGDLPTNQRGKTDIVTHDIGIKSMSLNMFFWGNAMPP